MTTEQIKFPLDLTKINSKPSYYTGLGAAFCGDSLQLLNQLPDQSINLVLTSPPFALQRQKEYGNKTQSEYIEWLAQFARVVYQKLKDDGSFVLDLGGAYEKGKPVRSLYNFRVPIYFCDRIGFFLAEDFYWFNPSKLPSPIEWVNKRKIRVKDSINTVWWFSKSEFPKSDVTKVLTDYSPRMQKLLADPDKFYNAKKRPSGHDISKSFAQNNGGAIPCNLLQIPNTDSNSQYLRGCKALGLKAHPARFPSQLPKFFIQLLTDPGDIVVDIFSGSNTTGFVAEQECRHWLAFETDLEYVATSSLRFMEDKINQQDLSLLHQKVMLGESVPLLPHSRQLQLF
ncbi:site-specific DNA-methyltransferase [Arthrospira sp. O9.13F]|nr:site-specific DNA-methyltransferase [Arthrospira sp. O9.13F]